MRGEPLREERRAVVGRAQHYTRRHRCRPPFGRESTRRSGRFFRRCAVDCGRSGGSSGRPVARGRPGCGSNVGRGRAFRCRTGGCGSPGSIDCRGGIHCRRGGAIHRRGGTLRRIGAPFRRCRAGRGARFRGGERRAAQGFAPARRSGRPRGTRGRGGANRRAIRRRTIGFHGVVLFFSVNELGSGRALSGATPPKGCFSAVRRSRAARRSSARGARANPAGQILWLVRRVGRPSPWGEFLRGQILWLVRRVGRPLPWGAFLRGANPFARAPSRVRPRRRCVFPAVRRSGAARRSSACGANANPRGANPFARAPCREAFAVGSVPARGKPFRSCAVSGGLRRGGVFLRGANSFARAPCREAFAEGAFLRGANPAHHSAPCREAFAVGSVLARGKFFCSCAVSGGFRRGERFCAGQILSLVRRVGKPSPRRAFLRGQIFSLVRRVGRPSPRSVFLRG